MVTAKNIIKKLNIEVQTPSVTIGTHYKDKLGDFLKDEIIPELNIQLDDLAKQFPNKIVRFGKIELDINLDETSNFKTLKPLILTALKKQITKNTFEADRMNTVIPHVLTSSKNESDAFLFFIETGTYPWWYDSKKTFTKKGFQKMLEVPSFSEILKQKLQEKHIQKRVIFQFDFELIEAIYTAISDVKDIRHTSISITKNREFQTYKVPFWTAVFDYSLTQKDAGLLQKLETILSNNTKASSKNGIKKYKVDTLFLKEASKIIHYVSELLSLGIVFKKTKTKNISLSLEKNTSPSASNKRNIETIKTIESTTVNYTVVEPEKLQDETSVREKSENKPINLEVSEEGIFVENAGLVLLHPFLPKLFEKLGFLSEDSKGSIEKEILPHKKATAVHLLHYLAGRKEQPYEHELIIEKYLCGLPLEESLERMIILTEEQKEECNSLLTAVLEHWSELKSSNTELLQNEFLMREGKLFYSKDTEKIYVQRKTIDILLNKLPWNIGFVKLPWKQNIFYTEW